MKEKKPKMTMTHKKDSKKFFKYQLNEHYEDLFWEFVMLLTFTIFAYGVFDWLLS